MRKARFRRWIAPNPCCRYNRATSAERTTTNATGQPLFAALELKTSHVIGQLHRRHRSQEFRRFLHTLETNVPTELVAHIILDNYGTHKTAIIRKWFTKRPRFHVHFTPTYGPGSTW